MNAAIACRRYSTLRLPTLGSPFFPGCAARRRGVSMPAAMGTLPEKMTFVSPTLNSHGEPEIFLERLGTKGGLARLTLNKPERLNALSLSMVRAMADAIEENFGKFSLPLAQQDQDDDSPKGAAAAAAAAAADEEGARLLVLKGAGEKAFCAGGDVKAICLDKPLGLGVTGTLRSDFFREEYLVDYRLANVAKQRALLSLWDGVVMGGGVGISIHGTFRVATETTLFAMPETVIGIFPDVGSAYVLSRLPGGLGQYLGLTGARLRGSDLLHCGLATHLVPRDRLRELEEALVEDDGRNPASVLERFASETVDLEDSALAKQTRFIDGAFGGAESVEEIVRRLEERSSNGAGHSSVDPSEQEWARATLEKLSEASPTALKVTHRHIAWASTATLEDTLCQDFRVMQHMMATRDFEEGVRARLIDKHNAPAWSPNTLESVSEEAVKALFAEIGDHELVLP